MINLIDMILIVDNVISDYESKLLISEFETNELYKTYEGQNKRNYCKL